MSVKLNTVLIEITDRCNLNCAHCMNRPDSKGSESSVELLDSLLYKLDQSETEKVYLSGGEPLVHPNLLEIIKLCYKYPKIIFYITTNGLLLSEELLNIIESIPNLFLQFSIDGVTTESYEELRGKDTFPLFMKAISLWDRISTKRGLARTCINKYNVKELPMIFQFCLKHRLQPSFVFLSSLGNGETNWSRLETSLGEKIWCIDQINKLSIKYGIDVMAPEAPGFCSFTNNKAEIASLLIRADGSVPPCQYFYDISLGNAFEDSIENIVTNQLLKKYCEIAQERKKILSKSEKCKTCKIRKGCGFGCLGKAAALGDIMSYDGLCELRVMTTVCYSNRLITMNQKLSKKNAVIPEVIELCENTQ